MKGAPRDIDRASRWRDQYRGRRGVHAGTEPDCDSDAVLGLASATRLPHASVGRTGGRVDRGPSEETHTSVHNFVHRITALWRPRSPDKVAELLGYSRSTSYMQLAVLARGSDWACMNSSLFHIEMRIPSGIHIVLYIDNYDPRAPPPAVYTVLSHRMQGFQGLS